MLDKIALTLAIIGGINWGSIGLGISALWCISLLVRDRSEVFKTSRSDQ